MNRKVFAIVLAVAFVFGCAAPLKQPEVVASYNEVRNNLVEGSSGQPSPKAGGEETPGGAPAYVPRVIMF